MNATTKCDRVSLLQGMEIVTMEQIWQLDNMGYFDAPASISHHGNYDGGLFDHSFAVTNALVELTVQNGHGWGRPQSPYIVGMFHDLCKMDDYKYDLKSKQWTRRDDCMLDGHGTKSVMMLSQFLTLTEEEILCIRYHMGAYETDDWKGFDRAIRKYPNVLMTHTADMIASKVVGV